MFSAGWATVNITPPLGVALAGYYVSEGRTAGASEVFDELHAKALVLEHDDGPVVLVTTDLIGMPDSFFAEAVTTVSKRTGIPAESIILTASHNHSGPMIDTLPEGHNLFAGVLDFEYRTVLMRKLASAVELAQRRACPARFGFARTQSDINVVRRQRDAEGRFKPLPYLGQNWEAPVDRTVAVLGFENSMGERAIVVNYACHAVVLGPNIEISSDYPGAMQRFAERALGADTTVMFTNGAEGDSNPIIHPGTREDAERLGRRLGSVVIEAVERLQPEDVQILRQKRALVSLPLRQRPSLAQEAELLEHLNQESRAARAERAEGLLQCEMDHSVLLLRHLRRKGCGHSIEAEIAALRINDTVMVTIPGELFNALGREVIDATKGVSTVLMGLANGHVGYLPNAAAYEEGGFEVEATALAPGAGETLRDNLIALVQGLAIT